MDKYAETLNNQFSFNEIEHTLYIPDNFKGFPASLFCGPECDMDDIDYVLIPHGLIVDRTKKIAHNIWNNMDGSRHSVFLCVMKGAIRFFELLIENISYINEISEKQKPYHTDYIRTSSYKGITQTNNCDIFGITSSHLKNADIIIVEDIVDSGSSLEKLIQIINEHSPNSVSIVTLLTKRNPNNNKIKANYSCFNIPNVWIVGFGMDIDEKLRNLNHVYVMNEKGVQKYID